MTVEEIKRSLEALQESQYMYIMLCHPNDFMICQTAIASAGKEDKVELKKSTLAKKGQAMIIESYKGHGFSVKPLKK